LTIRCRRPRPDRHAPDAAFREGHSRGAFWFAALLIVVAVARLLQQTADYGLLGHDTYPIIVTSRIQSWNDFVGTFTERLMDWRYPGAFYRPLLNLSFAADYAIWGLEPFGYQLTNIVVFAGCALVLFALAGRLAGSSPVVASLATLVAFLVHPSHFEVIPVPARRPELLSGAFMALSLWLQLAPRALHARRAPLLPAVAALAAIAAKETAFVLPLLTFAVVFLYAPQASGRGRLWCALRALGPQVVVMLLMLGARGLVLGGLGGHGDVTAGQALRAVPGDMLIGVRGLLQPQAALREGFAAYVPLVLALGLLTTAVLWKVNGPGPRPGGASMVAVGLMWIVAVEGACATAREIAPWYYFLPVMGWSLCVGGLTAALVELTRTRGAAVRWATAATLVFLGLLVVGHARFSPLFHRYDQWRRGTAVSGDFLRQVRRLLESSQPGTVVLAPPIPVWVQPSAGAPTIYGAALLSAYSVQAWADLTLTDKKVVVAVSPASTGRADAVRLLIARRLPGY